MVSEMDGGSGRPTGEPGDGALPALPVIQRFGGIRPMAQKLGVPVSTVQGWKERGAIPANRREEVMAAAERHGIALEPADLSAAFTAAAIALPDDSDTSGAASAIGETEPVPTMPAEEPATAAWDATPDEETVALSGDAPATAQPFGPAPAAAPASGRSALLPAVLAAAAVALAISASAPWWTRAIGLAPQQAAPAGDAAGQAQALERRIAALESRPPAGATGGGAASELAPRLDALEQANAELKTALDRLAAAPGSATGGAPAPELAQRLDAVAGDLASVKEQLQGLQRENAQAVAPERLSAFSDRIEENAAELRAMQGELSRLVELPKRVQDLAGAIEAASGQTQRTAFVLASGQLEAALDSGQPYASELGAVRRLAAEDPQLPALLEKLDEHSDEGIPGMAELRLRFDDVALAAAQAAQSEIEGDWMDRAWARLRSLVTVRPVGGDVAGDSPEAHLARAEARLDEGDLAGAVSELEALEGPAAEAAAPWLAGARARVAADQAIEALRERALARVLPNGSGG